jgi:putative membrane protein
MTMMCTANDLPIARFCADLYRECKEMLGEGGSNGDDWTPSPFAPASSSTSPATKKEQ